MPRARLPAKLRTLFRLVVPAEPVNRQSSARRALPQRAYAERLALGAVSAAGAFLSMSSGCGTEAVGIDACRDIELARCEAAGHCGTVDDVDACRRFYRDHCLHGLAKGLKAPPQEVVDACVATIEKAGQCARGDRTAPIASCTTPITTDPNGAHFACDIVRCPEYSAECSFLGSTQGCTLPDAPGAGGQGGQGAE